MGGVDKCHIHVLRMHDVQHMFTLLIQAGLTINNGKDFTGDKMELIGTGHPGGFMSLHGVNTDFMVKGGSTFLNYERVRNVLWQSRVTSLTDG